MINFLNNLIPLILGHFVADFAIQTDTVALNKCPKNNSRISWAWWMTGHVSIHGFIVYFFNRFFINCCFGGVITFLY